MQRCIAIYYLLIYFIVFFQLPHTSSNAEEIKTNLINVVMHVFQ